MANLYLYNQKMVLPLILVPIFMTQSVLTYAANNSLDSNEPKPRSGFVEQLNEEERQELIKALLEEGDGYFDNKDYDRATQSYEQIFRIVPEHAEASEKLDRVKKQRMVEGKTDETFIEDVYGAEIDLRVRHYWKQVDAAMEKGKWGEARFALEKIILVDPANVKAIRLYEQIKKKSSGEPYET
nr:hypothetical protein JG2_0180 [uncultured bacterium]